MAPSAEAFNLVMTVLSLSSILTVLPPVPANKVARRPFGFCALYALANNVIKSSSLFDFWRMASLIALLRPGSLELLARVLIRPSNSTSNVTLIPP